MGGFRGEAGARAGSFSFFSFWHRNDHILILIFSLLKIIFMAVYEDNAALFVSVRNRSKWQANRQYNCQAWLRLPSTNPIQRHRNHPRQLYWNLAKIWSCFFRTFPIYHLFLMSKKWYDIFRIILKWFYFIAPMTPFWSHDVFVFFLSTNNAVLFNSASSFNNGMTLALLGRRPQSALSGRSRALKLLMYYILL